MEFTLNASDLIKKHGFSDGMIFLDVLDDCGFSDELDPIQLASTLSSMGGNVSQDNPDEPIGTSLHEVVLYRLVEQTLMPKLLGFTLVLDTLSSNGVRLAEGWAADTQLVADAIKDISAVVNEEQILVAAREVVTTYELHNSSTHALR